MTGPVARQLDGGRLHLQHGPIDLIIGAEGTARLAALRAARQMFDTILQELVDELPVLRQPVADAEPFGKVARLMKRAVASVAGANFATPMAAVAGAVADEVLAAMRAAGPLDRVYVNNGGDIALWLGPGARYSVALAGLNGNRLGRVELTCDHKIGGIATSGRGGRSLTMGIADSVTVLAENAAIADAAATLIANSTDLPDHPAVRRQRADGIDPDSDLRHRLVVTGVARLSAQDRTRALDAGLSQARALTDCGAIRGAAVFLQGDSRAFGLSNLTLLTKERLLHA